MIQTDASGDGLTPELLRRRGLRRALAAEIALTRGSEDGAEEARAAIGDLVEAFLHDRRANADLYARAHRLGALLSRSEGCRWKSGSECYTLACPIYALHRPVAHSVAMTVATHCSICGAAALQCEHIPGEPYDGQRCYAVVDEICSVGHIAITADPGFLYTWNQTQQQSTARLIQDGIIKRSGDPAWCTHCQDCPGAWGPTDGDLDPVSRFEQLQQAHSTADRAQAQS
jgi:hypothetical protein